MINTFESGVDVGKLESLKSVLGNLIEDARDKVGDKEWFVRADNLFKRLEIAIKGLQNGNNPKSKIDFDLFFTDYQQLVEEISLKITG